MTRRKNMADNPRFLGVAEAKEMLQLKRWSVSNLAFRWKMRRETLSRLINNPRRPQRITDGIVGLPRLSAGESRALTVQRLDLVPPVTRPRKQVEAAPVMVPLFEVGAILLATAPVGSVAEEGDEGIVMRVDIGSTNVFYKIRWPYGDDLFSEVEIENIVVDSGRVKK